MPRPGARREAPRPPWPPDPMTVWLQYHCFAPPLLRRVVKDRASSMRHGAGRAETSSWSSEMGAGRRGRLGRTETHNRTGGGGGRGEPPAHAARGEPDVGKGGVLPAEGGRWQRLDLLSPTTEE